MDKFVAQNYALRRPVLGRPYKGASLQQLKAAAQAIERNGGTVIDQSAGDISLVGKDLSPAFKEYRKDIGSLVKIKSNPRNPGVYDQPQNYAAEYPEVLKMIAKGLGITAPFEGMSTVSGRAAINCFLTTVRQASSSADLIESRDTKPVLIVDPLTWSGYQDSAGEIGIQLVYSPMVNGHGLLQSPEGVMESIEMVKNDPSLRLMGVTTIQPSNPTGLGVSVETLKAIAEICAKENIFFNIDAFYSVIARNGTGILGLKELQELAPEVLGKISVLVGETKATDSQKKTASMFWFSPEGYEGMARTYMAGARKVKGNWNLYARPDEAITAAALWSFPSGIHTAMGPRFDAISEARREMEASLSSKIPFIIGDSFYGTGVLFAPDGHPLVRDSEGRPVSDTKQAMDILLSEYNLMVAPGAMFRPEGAELLARFTAASTPEEIAKVSLVVNRLLTNVSK